MPGRSDHCPEAGIVEGVGDASPAVAARVQAIKVQRGGVTGLRVNPVASPEQGDAAGPGCGAGDAGQLPRSEVRRGRPADGGRPVRSRGTEGGGGGALSMGGFWHVPVPAETRFLHLAARPGNGVLRGRRDAASWRPPTTGTTLMRPNNKIAPHHRCQRWHWSCQRPAAPAAEGAKLVLNAQGMEPAAGTGLADPLRRRRRGRGACRRTWLEPGTAQALADLARQSSEARHRASPRAGNAPGPGVPAAEFPADARAR
ncbi:hypothetical protein ACE0DR_28870 [Azotobacter sp. CWF10]